jgi:hypothetical protein
VAQGLIRYRCFLPDLTEFTVPPCTGPNYQQSTSTSRLESKIENRRSRSSILDLIRTRLAERGGFEPPVPVLGVHTISSRAPSTARSPLRFGFSKAFAPCPALFSANVSKMSPGSFFGVLGNAFANLPQGFARGKDETRDCCALYD